MELISSDTTYVCFYNRSSMSESRRASNDNFNVIS
jgi:hypothetical protein